MSAPRMSLFTNADGRPLTKIYRRVNGVLRARQAPMARGSVERLTIPTADELAKLLATCRSDQALGLGTCDWDERIVVTQNRWRGPPVIPRTLDFFHFADEPTWALIDSDLKSAPASVRDRLRASGGLWSLLGSIAPELQHVAHVTRPSASASLIDADTRARLLDGGGHGYFLIDDGTTMKAILDQLHRLCWAHGLGWIAISRAGQLLERSLIDVSVASPERIVNEGPPVTMPDRPTGKRNLAIDMSQRLVRWEEGDPLLSARLTDIDDETHWARVEDARKPLRETAIKRAIAHLTKLGLDDDDTVTLAVGIATRHGRPVHCLPAAYPLTFRPGVKQTVMDVLVDPSSYVNRDCLDPFEPFARDYCARVLRGRQDGAPFIRSYMHGGIYYLLDPQVDAALMEMAVNAIPDMSADELMRAMGEDGS
jgi:hypothetical protein